LLDALLLRAGYNAALVAIGASLLGAAAGFIGTFLLLRRRALVSDAMSHATLPGVALAYMALVALGGDGRSLPWLMAGAAASAALGVLLVHWATARTRLTEDAAIGAVLSVFFGFGIVLLTIIQGMPGGRQAGLQSFLLGSTAGMLFADAVLIAAGGAFVAAAALVLSRALTAVAFDAGHAAALGVNVARTDLALLALVLAVTVVGLKLAGLVLIVALLIIPPVAARFWTDRSGVMAGVAALIGAASAYAGAILSTALPQTPTGPMIVLVAFGLFALSMLFAPARGVAARLLAIRRFQASVHRRQGLLALAHDETIHDALTLRVLRTEGLIRADGVATDAGRAAAARALRDEKRWETARRLHPEPVAQRGRDGLARIEEVLTPDEIAAIDQLISEPRLVGSA
jgi:manganese/zinc/iron transport system permease protein